MDNDNKDRARKQEGRKRSLEKTDDEDDEIVAHASTSTSLANQVEGMMSELSSTLKDLHVGGNEEKRIKTDLPEVRVRKEKMEEGTSATTTPTFENGSRDEKKNEHVFINKQLMKKPRDDGVKQAAKKRSVGNMVTAVTPMTSAPPSSTSNGTPGPGHRAAKSASSRLVKSEKMEESGSSCSIAVASSSKGFRGGMANDDGFEPLPILIPRSAPEVGDSVYAMFKNLEYPWLKAEVLEIVENSHTEQTEYVIRFEPTDKNGEPSLSGGEEETAGETFRKMVQVCLKMMAAWTPPTFQLPVGSRVIAKLVEKTDEPAQFYAGIIADYSNWKERPKSYLVFFDLGSSQYVHADHVRMILDSDKHVWNDVYPDSYDFIKEYSIRYPNWPLVTLRIGQLVATERNGLWLPARIRKLDENLAYAQFENDGQGEWIYRGSGRFRPVTVSLLRAEKRRLRNMQLKQLGSQGEGEPLAKKVKKAKACSSYSAKEIYKQLLFFSAGDTTGIENPFRIQLDDPTLCVEYQGKLKKVEISPSSPCTEQEEFKEHYCDWFCVVPYTDSSKDFRKISPLMIPLFFGWTRHIITEEFRHDIFYKAPCGVRLNDAKDLYEFLKLTLCDFTIDYFSFDYDVDCENEFVPARDLLKREDISGGKEVRCVSLVNSIDDEAPDAFEYLRESVLGPGVVVTEDKGFLACCDCEDGQCEDEDKCACWQMTKQGVDFTLMNDHNYPTQGYELRKLHDKLQGAIYECNERCACKKSCTNRVVQNGGQWPLQVFKTRGKGWGVRTLFDIPSGTFVGYYVGEIFNSDYAEGMGKRRGDEYFLQLDYIEMCVEAKGGDYEEDVTDIEMEEDADADADDEDDSMEEGEGGAKKGRRRGDGGRRGDDGERKKLRERRRMFGRKEDVYVIDSKMKGSVTRFMNACCNPNLYPQNVFVNCQDLRFPMVALFTSMHIRAGSELTWDYNYSVGAVPGTEVHCQCMAYNCKGRLL